VRRRQIFFALNSSSVDLPELASLSLRRFLLLLGGSTLAISDSLTSVALTWETHKQRGFGNPYT
jgi:hypothetical protein